MPNSGAVEIGFRGAVGVGEIMLEAVKKRLRADVPVGSYLSGGVDSSLIAALACHLKGSAINTYTIRVDAPELDELDAANLVARHIGTKPPIVQEFGAADAVNTYPELIHAAEAPVVDTSCAAQMFKFRDLDSIQLNAFGGATSHAGQHTKSNYFYQLLMTQETRPPQSSVDTATEAPSP